jgi:hypothetical protein
MRRAREIVRRVLENLHGRSGFDHILDGLEDDAETRNELTDTLAELVDDELVEVERDSAGLGPVRLVELNPGVFVNPRHVVVVTTVPGQKPVQDAADKLGAMIWCVGGPGQNIGIVGMTAAQVVERLREGKGAP